MKIILPCFIFMLLQGKQKNSFGDNLYISFATINAKSISTDASSASIIYFNGIIKNDRVILNWTTDKNQEADKFGTDEPNKVKYQFYEKNKNVKVFYRIKIIQKDFSVEYSAIISPETFPAIE